mmetsp:Transcript_19762/g.32417  ORF Transcript_19762/g.32417 Transcript_19762/m.32417 type:complete len:92 (+) Transcript_19762:67-342(+)
MVSFLLTRSDLTHQSNTYSSDNTFSVTPSSFSSFASSYLKRTTCSNYNLFGSLPFFRTNSLDGFDNIHALYYRSKDNMFVIQTSQRLLPCA